MKSTQNFKKSQVPCKRGISCPFFAQKRCWFGHNQAQTVNNRSVSRSGNGRQVQPQSQPVRQARQQQPERRPQNSIGQSANTEVLARLSRAESSLNEVNKQLGSLQETMIKKDRELETVRESLIELSRLSILTMNLAVGSSALLMKDDEDLLGKVWKLYKEKGQTSNGL